MRIAFYAPGNAWRTAGNGHAPAAGTRAALEAAGLEVMTVAGPADAGAALDRARGERLAGELADRCRRRPPGELPEVWVTEGLAPDAPDWFGPLVCRQLGIPYVLLEPHAMPLNGHGDEHRTLREIVGFASAVITTSSVATESIRPLVADPGCVTQLLPFIDVAPLVSAGHVRANHRAAMRSHLIVPEESAWLLTDGAMEHGAALESYRLLARALSRLPGLVWHLIVIGDGPARAEVETLLRILPAEKVRLRRKTSAQERFSLLVCCDLYVWPALEWAQGPALLEAQAGGLPVIACRSPAVLDHVVDGQTGRLAAAGNAESFANSVSFLLREPTFREPLARQARESTITHHDVRGAAATIAQLLIRVRRDHRAG